MSPVRLDVNKVLIKEEQDILIHMKSPGKFKGLLNGVDVRNET